MEENKQDGREIPGETLHPKVMRRARLLLVIAFSLLGLLLVRILLYQTVGYGKYQQKVIDQMTTESSVIADRGNIYDANGILLATNVTTYRVFIAPSAIASAQSEMNRQGEGIQLDSMISEQLADILSLSEQFVLEQTTYTKKLDRTLKNKVNEDTADRVRAVVDEYGWHQFVHLQATSTRYYPYSTLASHALGFTGSDGTGLYGLEYYYNEQLSGTNGRYIIARDAQGNEMPYGYEEFIAAQDGADIYTTLDVYVQSALEEQLKTAYTESNGQNRAAGVVMDVNTGGILAMATYPSFDLNDPWELDLQSARLLESCGIDPQSEEYSSMRQSLLLKMWSNKAITDPYVPGSTFKVITAAMALEEAVVEVDDSFSCPGYRVVADRKIHCHKTKGHGALTFTEGIQQSCNPVLMAVGLELGGATFSDYLSAFGYREKTGVDLPGEGLGRIFTKQELTEKEYAAELNLAISAFGQNIKVNLMQQITAVSAVANGGYLVTPHLLSRVVDANGNVIKSFEQSVRRQVVSTTTCQTVSEILEEGVSGDGGAKNAYVMGYRVAAKTGTSEKNDEFECPRCDNVALVKSINGENKFVCSVCGYTGDNAAFKKSEDYVCSTVAYAPADDPRYAVIIIVDEPSAGVLYGSTVAAPYVGAVMETILPYLGVEAKYSEAELDKMTVTVPKCTAWSASYATQRLEALGLAVEVIGDPSGIVSRQYPEGNTVMEKKSGKVVLYTSRDIEPQTQTVPNVVGMTAAAANQTLINHGFNIRILGTKNYLSGTGAVVVAQSVAAGEYAPKGSVIEITFRYLDEADVE